MNSAHATTATAQSPSSGVRIQFVWHAVRRHPIIFILLLLLAGGAGGVAWAFLPLPKATGVTVFHISSQPPALLNPTLESRIEFGTYKTMQAAMVKQRLVLSTALSAPEAQDLPTLQREPDQVAYLERNLQVDFKLGPEFMRVEIEGNDDAELMKILALVSKAYLEEVDKKDNGVRKRRYEDLSKRREKYIKALQGYQEKLTGLATVLRSSDPAVLAVMEELATKRLQQLQMDILRNERELEQADLDAKFFKEKAGQAAKVVVPESEIERAISREDGVIAMEKAIAAKRADVEELDKSLRDKSHPRLTAARKAVEAAEADLRRHREELRPQVVEALRQQMVHDNAVLAAKNSDRKEALEKTKDALDQAFTEITTEIGNKTKVFLQLETVRKDMARSEKLYDQIVTELEQLDLERGTPLRVTVADPPYIVNGIEGNRRLKSALMAAGGILLVGLVGLVFWESRNRVVQAIDDVGKGLGLKVFGTVPPVAPADEPSPTGEAALAEAIDTARTMLLYGVHGSAAPKTVLVTSALPSEGKTSLSGHLAISLARAGYRTLLVDADLRNPANHHVFDVPATPGLCDLLRGEAGLGQAARRTRFPGLDILPAGRWNLAATQALGGERWTAVRSAVEAEYDFVVIDSAPVLPVVDSLLLARHVDGVLLSVMHDHSRVASVAEAQHRLMSIGANVLGVVVNGVEPRGGGYGYAAYGYPADPAAPVVTLPA